MSERGSGDLPPRAEASHRVQPKESARRHRHRHRGPRAGLREAWCWSGIGGGPSRGPSPLPGSGYPPGAPRGDTWFGVNRQNSRVEFRSCGRVADPGTRFRARPAPRGEARGGRAQEGVWTGPQSQRTTDTARTERERTYAWRMCMRVTADDEVITASSRHDHVVIISLTSSSGPS